MGKLKTQNKAHLNNLAKIGIFASFLIITVFVVWFYSPVIRTHADDSITSQVDVDVQPVISLNLSDDELNFDITPKSSGSVSESKTVTASVRTNSLYGYQLYFSSEDNSTNMVSSNGSFIESLTSKNSALSVPSDKNGVWGYSKTGETSSWNPIPALSTPKALKTSFNYSSASSDIVLYIGIAAKSSLPSGRYSKNVSFTAITGSASPAMDLNGITYMQQMTPSICANAQIGSTTTLVDSRDDEEYVIMKTADDMCWMMQDLRLVGPYTLTSSDSNVVDNFELPAPSSTWTQTYDAPVSRAINNPSRNEGIGYNFYAASAGSISGEENIADTNVSVCPKGWHLPTKAQLDAFLEENDITDDENGANKLYNSPFNFELVNSSYTYDNYNSSNWMADYWTRTNWSTYENLRRHRWTLHITRGESFSAKAYLHDRHDSGTIRCVSEDTEAVPVL